MKNGYKLSYKRKFHNLTGTPEYRVWASTKTRCYNDNSASYSRYGGRGIKVCDRWRYSFENFILDMGKRPSPKHTIDRKNNDGNYEPSNCRWATHKEQNNNKSNVMIYNYMGDRCNARELSKYLSVKYRTLSKWLKDFGLEQAIVLSQSYKPYKLK